MGSPTDAQILTWREAYAASRMVGWDFSRLDGRLEADEPGWDFDAECRGALATASRAADLGTGGGEKLISLLESAARDPGREVAATEGWQPNIAIARRSLAPYGVRVHAHDVEAGQPLPFPDESLDLVIARHEDFNAHEVARVLSPGGRFLTQQVDGTEAHELREWFGGNSQYADVTLANVEPGLRAEGLLIEAAEEWVGQMVFADVLTLVEYLALVPWDVPGFSVDGNLQQLKRLDAARPIVVTQRRFRLIAVRD